MQSTQMYAKVVEVFRSIQGEGKYLGVDQIFVRFFDCNLDCVWCDTEQAKGTSKDNYMEFTVDDICNLIKKLKDYSHSVSLTGGEPLLQKDFLKELIPRIREMFFPVYLETNGTLVRALEEVIDDINIISMDIKLPSSARTGDLWEQHREFLKVAIQKRVFVKAVVTEDTILADIQKTSDLIKGSNPNITLVLQPNCYDEPVKMMNICWEFQKECLKQLRDVRIIPQMHKLWGIQ